jgi:hypothetical protein
MKDGSQSPITLKLNLLSQRRVAGAGWRNWALARLRDGDDLAEIAASASFEGVVIASKGFERRHIQKWPLQQQILLRQILIEAITQNRQVIYDWTASDQVKFTVRDMGGVIGITFYNPPDHALK